MPQSPARGPGEETGRSGVTGKKQHPEIKQGPLRRLWGALGPGLITGAADDDPSGIATYSQAGAQFGYGLGWTLFLTFPLMGAIQIIAGLIGAKTGKGLTPNIAGRLPRPVLLALVAVLIVANTVNIAADLAAMGDAVTLIVGGNRLVFAALFGLACLAAEILIPYHRYAGYLKLAALVLLIYVAAALSVHVSWLEVLKGLALPDIAFDKDMLLTVVAIFGTTISPYLFFWQASQEAEDAGLAHRAHAAVDDVLRRISFDTWTGMAFSNFIALFIMITAAATLHAQGVTKLDSAAQAAEALRPIAGDLTFILFAVGIIGTGLLAVPVLAGSAAYGVAEAFGMRGSLELPAGRALGFYGIVGAATLGGVALAATDISPIAMLFWAAVINGAAAVPIMIAMMLVVSGAAKDLALPPWIKALGWLAAVVMGLTVAALLWLSF
ncbi:MAG: divalent metal cation transporter [Rhodospirillaceae bacterium]|nr:divalent metal cation transporter [Rhodospirillaceae bacterium]